jgi:hypothetical protein
MENKRVIRAAVASVMALAIVAVPTVYTDSAISSTISASAATATTVKTASALASAVKTGGTVTLGADITASITIPSGVTVTINLNGKTLTNASGSDTITVSKGATLSISGKGTIDNVSNKCSALVNNGGTVRINSGAGTITRSKESATNTYYVVQNNSGTLNINGGSIVSTSTISSAVINKGTLNMGGGSITNAFIALKNEGTLNILGGTITTNGAGGSALQNWSGTATISGGSLVAQAPAEATLNVTAEEGSKTASKVVVTQDADISGAVLVAQSDSDAEVVPEVVISGGSIDGVVAVGNVDDESDYCLGKVTIDSGVFQQTVAVVENTTGEEAELTVNNGVFAELPTLYIDEDKLVASVSSEGETVYVVAKDNDTVVDTIEETLGGVSEGDTIDIKQGDVDVSTVKNVDKVTVTTDGKICKDILKLKKQILGIIPKDVENYDLDGNGQVDVIDLVLLKGTLSGFSK